MRILQKYAAMQAVPETLLLRRPRGPDSSLGSVVFSCDCYLMECDDSTHLLIPADPIAMLSRPSQTPMGPLFLFAGVRNCELSAPRTVSFISSLFTSFGPDDPRTTGQTRELFDEQPPPGTKLN